MTDHYAYRLPPDTFLARRDANWYIGAAAGAAVVSIPTPESFAQLEALVAKARKDFDANAAAWISEMNSVVGRLAPTFVTSMKSLAENLRTNVFEGTIPRLMARVKAGEPKQKDIAHLIKISAEALKTQYEDGAKEFRAMGPVSTLMFRVVSGLVQAADAIGAFVLEAAIKVVEEVGDAAARNPLGFAVVAGGALAVLALYFYINKKR